MKFSTQQPLPGVGGEEATRELTYPDIARVGGKDASRLEEALAKVKGMLGPSAA